MGRKRQLKRTHGRIKLVDENRRVIGYFNSYIEIAEYIERQNWKSKTFYAVPKPLERVGAIRRVDVDKFGIVYVENYGNP